MLPKGCACIIIIPFLISSVALLVYLFVKTDYSWCGPPIEAGDCEIYNFEGKHTCYCIDGDKPNNDTKSIGLYKQVKQNCQKLNGSLATPDLKETLKWLAKRMFHRGFDNALIALVKSEGIWYWDKFEGFEIATNIPWHPDFPPNVEHTYGVVTVKTVLKESLAEDEYEYEYHNYDHYLDDNDYVWFGFSTTDNMQVHNVNGYFYYICHYITQPQVSFREPATDQPSTEVDECYCENEEIFLEDLDDSQTFQSPRYPKNYCSDHNCRWTIKTKDTLAIKLEWLVFDTETNMDFVIIYNGDSSDGPLIDRCTGNRCGSAISDANAMHVNFKSDHVTTDLGFRARVTAISDDPCYCSKLSKITFSNLADSYKINSPKYPLEYCTTNYCKWTISVEQNHGLQIVWNAFDIEERDYVYVYDGESENDEKLLICSHTVCETAMTSGKHMYIVFATDGTPSKRIGFSAVITPFVNYCEKDTHSTINGSVIYTKEYEDGTIPDGESATLTCPPNTKLKNTYHLQHDNVTCEKWAWSKELHHCVPGCEISSQQPSDKSDISICTREQKSDAHLVESSHTLQVHRIQSAGSSIKTHTKLLTCSSEGWKPEVPMCHFDWIGILFIGGYEVFKNPFASMELYNPLDNTTKQLETELLIGRANHVATVLEDGRVFVAGGENEEPMSHTEIVDLLYGSQQGPPLPFTWLTHDSAAVTKYGNQIWVCGGNVYKCEIWDGGQWSPSTPLPSSRTNPALVALGTAIKISIHLLAF